MAILIFGSRGYLGKQFLDIFEGAKGSGVDIADREAVAQELDRVQPSVVINTAGKTGKPNVDWCEDHKLETLRSNVLGPLVLLEECMKRNIYLVHVSSGCIYEGPFDSAQGDTSGFTEDDPPNFFGSFYSRTKGWSDQILKDFPNILILRLRMPFSNKSHDRNLMSKLIKYKKVLNVQNSLTYLPDFLDAAKKLIEKGKTGVYNIVNPGVISPYEIMGMYKKIVQEDHVFEELNLKELATTVKAGRSNCVLSTKKLEEEGITFPDVHVRVEEALRSIASTHSS